MSSEARKAAAAKPTWTCGAPLLALVLLPILLSYLLVLSTGFDGLYGQDPYAYYAYAIGPLRDKMLALEAPPPFFWPPGYPLLVALTSLLVGITPLAGQLVSLVGGGLTAAFTVLLAKEVWADAPQEWWLPWLAGLLVGLVGQLWQHSAMVMSDTTALAFATFGVGALVRYGRQAERTGTPHVGWLALAATGLSYAVLTRWAYALVAIPCAVYTGWCLLRQPTSRAARHATGAALLTATVLSPVLVPISEIVLAKEDGTSGFVGDLEVYSWNPATALRRVHRSLDGVLAYRLPNGLFYAVLLAHPSYFGPILAPLLLPGLWRVLRRPGPHMLLLLGWIAVIYVFHSGAPWQNYRFAFAYLPPMAILAAIGFDGLTEAIRPRYRWTLGLLLILGLAVMSYGGWRLTGQFLDRKQTSLETVRWVERQVPPGAQLITFEITPTFQHYSWIDTHEIFFVTTEDLATLLATGRPTYVLLNMDSVSAQWVGRTPEINYRWLQEQRGLTDIGAQGGYRLMRADTSP